MNVQEMLAQLKDYRSACTNTELDCLRIDARTFELWAATLEQHLTPRADGKPDSVEASVIQSARERIEFWKEAWIAVASTFNCTSKSSPAEWADRALKDFDARFSGEARSRTP